jgi:hypothetical protein
MISENDFMKLKQIVLSIANAGSLVQKPIITVDIKGKISL